MRAGARGAGAATAAHPKLLAEWEGATVGEWARRLGVATVELHGRVGSTSDRAAALVRAGRALPALVVADRQTAGRGRRGRRWASDSPWGLWFTVARAAPRTPPEVADGAALPGEPKPAPKDAAGTLPLRIGLAVARALESVAPGVHVQVKWPNDILVAGRKLGGVLCERAAGAVVAGIGLNLNHPSDALPKGLGLPATSIVAETGRQAPRGRVLTAAWEAMEVVWKRPEQAIPQRERIALDRRSSLAGRPVAVEGVVRLRSGRAKAVHSMPAVAGGVRPDGSLELVAPDGDRVLLVAGSASPR